MKIRSYSRKALVAFLMALLLITAVNLVSAAPTQIEQAQTGGTAVIQAGTLNVRSGPGVAYQVVAVTRWGDVVTLLGRNANSSWAKIRIASGVEGWVNAAYLSTDTAISSLPDLSETAVPDANARALINEGMLNVRSGPGMEYPVVVAIGNGNYVQVIGRDAASTWVKVVTHTGHQGWLNSIYTTMTVPLSAIPAVATPSAPTQPVQPPTDPVQPIEPSGATAVVTAGMLNVRSGPSMAYSVVSYLPYGQTVGVLGRATNSAWVKVQTPTGATGWINSEYTQMNTSLDALPVIDSAVSPYGTVTVISNGLNVRSGPSTSYSILAGVYYGTTLSLMGQNADGSWYQIQTPSGITGWVNAAYVQ